MCKISEFVGGGLSETWGRCVKVNYINRVSMVRFVVKLRLGQIQQICQIYDTG